MSSLWYIVQFRTLNILHHIISTKKLSGMKMSLASSLDLKSCWLHLSLCNLHMSAVLHLQWMMAVTQKCPSSITAHQSLAANLQASALGNNTATLRGSLCRVRCLGSEQQGNKWILGNSTMHSPIISMLLVSLAHISASTVTVKALLSHIRQVCHSHYTDTQ